MNLVLNEKEFNMVKVLLNDKIAHYEDIIRYDNITCDVAEYFKDLIKKHRELLEKIEGRK